MSTEYEYLTVVAIEAPVPEVDCGVGRVFVRLGSQDVYLKLTEVDGPLNGTAQRLSRQDLQGMEDGGSIVFLSNSIAAAPNTVALYVSEEFMHSIADADATLGSDLAWQAMPLGQKHFNIACAPAPSVTAHLNAWSLSFMLKSTHALVIALGSLEPSDRRRYYSEAETYVEFGLDATQDPVLRERLYLRLGVALLNSEDVDQVYNVYQTCAFSCPEWTWASYLDQLRGLTDSLRLRASLQSRVEWTKGYDPTLEISLPKAYGDRRRHTHHFRTSLASSNGAKIKKDARRPFETRARRGYSVEQKYLRFLILQVGIIRELPERDAQQRMAELVAKKHSDLLRDTNAFSPDVSDLVQRLTTWGFLKVSETDLLLLGCDPAFYMPDVIRIDDNSVVEIDTVKFRVTLAVFDKDSLGPVGAKIRSGAAVP